MSNAPIRYAQNGTQSIAYTISGSGEIPLIFVPGFISHLEIIRELPAARRFWERLGSFCRLVMFDKRGMGLSDRDGVSYTIEAVAEDMLAVLDDAGIERAAVFGISEGGAAATMFAANHPDRVLSLIEFGTYARLPRSGDNPAGIPVERLHRLRAVLYENWGDPSVLPLWAPSWEGDNQAAEWWGRLLRNGSTRGGVPGLGQMYTEMDVRPLLSTVRVPALVLWRRDDRLLPAGLSEAVAAGIPNARGVGLPGEDHLVFAGEQEDILGEVEEFLTGSRNAPAPRRALATVLFSDIVESTSRAAELGDARWRRLLEEHVDVASSVIEGGRGKLIKTTGDGVLATFDGPARAIAAGGGLIDALDRAGLKLRVGVHTGECEWIGDDVGGLAVHIGARVMAEAGPGEVLVSQTVRDLVVGSGIEFEERGTRELKGVPGEWSLFRVRDSAPVAGAS